MAGSTAGFSTSLRSGRNDEIVVGAKAKQISPLRCEMTNLKSDGNLRESLQDRDLI